jgi:hypothetical protein
MRSTLIAIIALTTTLGCQSRSAPPQNPVAAPAVAAQAADDRPTFENLDYANWKTFKVGTTITRRTETRIGANATISVDTYKLLDVNDRELVVERQNTTERTDGSYKKVNLPEKRTYAKSFKIPRGMKAEDFERPNPTAKEAGEETLTVCGKAITAKVYKWTDRVESGPMAVTVWVSDEVPGRIVKQEMKVAAIKSETVEIITEMTTS